MDYAKYAADAILTLASKEEQAREFHIDHAIIGLNTEIGELRENYSGQFSLSNLKEELGDVCWYGAVFAWAASEDFEALFMPDTAVHQRSPNRVVDHMHIYACMALDVTKKAMYYGKERDMVLLRRCFRECLASVQVLGATYGFLLSDIFEANNYKLLKKRFPEGRFTENRALNRDLAGEQASFNR